MPRLPDRVRGATGGISGASGGIAIYPEPRLYEEMAYLAYHLHWPYDQLHNLDHAERLRWVEEVSRINQRLNGEDGDQQPSSNWLEALQATVENVERARALG